MKKIIFICLLCLGTHYKLFAQNQPGYDTIKLVLKGDYAPRDTMAMQAANFLLATPIDKNHTDRMNAGQFIIRWMTGTPEYSFVLDDNSLKYFNDSPDLLLQYMAATTKAGLQTGPMGNSKTIMLNAMKLVIVYINNSNNDVHMTDNLKKLTEANNKGELESFLKLSGNK